MRRWKRLGVKEYFDKYAEEYVTQDRYRFKWYRWLIDGTIREASPKKGQRILELGAGTGLLTVKLSKLVGANGRVAAVDISGKMIEEARKAAEESGMGNIDFVVMPVERFEYPRERFDLVISNLAMDHVRDKKLLLRRIHGSMKGGGKLVIGLFFKPEPGYIRLVEEMRKKHPKEAGAWDRDWNRCVRESFSEGYWNEHPVEYAIGPLGLKRLMEDAGFEKIRVIRSYKPEIAVVSGTKR